MAYKYEVIIPDWVWHVRPMGWSPLSPTDSFAAGDRWLYPDGRTHGPISSSVNQIVREYYLKFYDESESSKWWPIRNVLTGPTKTIPNRVKRNAIHSRPLPIP